MACFNKQTKWDSWASSDSLRVNFRKCVRPKTFTLNTGFGCTRWWWDKSVTIVAGPITVTNTGVITSLFDALTLKFVKKLKLWKSFTLYTRIRFARSRCNENIAMDSCPVIRTHAFVAWAVHWALSIYAWLSGARGILTF